MDHVLDKISVKTLWPTEIYMSKIDMNLQPMIDEVYKIESVHKDIKKSNYGGWQSDVFLFKEEIFKPLCEKISKNCFLIFQKNTTLMHQMWACINRPGNQNLIHSHGNIYEISGVFYLKVPENSGDIVFRDPRPGAINAPGHGKLISTGGCENFKPEQGLLLLFPSFLDHFVLPNESDEDRISISFDLTLED